MDVTAITKFARLSPLKARALARAVQGLPAAEAMKVTKFTPGKAAQLLGKTLKSAVANAAKNAGLSMDELVVKTAVIEDGPRLRRFWPRARGSASPILKRLAHVRVVVTDGREEAPGGTK